MVPSILGKIGYDYRDEEENEFSPKDVLNQMQHLQSRLFELFKVRAGKFSKVMKKNSTEAMEAIDNSTFLKQSSCSPTLIPRSSRSRISRALSSRTSPRLRTRPSPKKGNQNDFFTLINFD